MQYLQDTGCPARTACILSSSCRQLFPSDRNMVPSDTWWSVEIRQVKSHHIMQNQLVLLIPLACQSFWSVYKLSFHKYMRIFEDKNPTYPLPPQKIEWISCMVLYLYSYDIWVIIDDIHVDALADMVAVKSFRCFLRTYASK